MTTLTRERPVRAVVIDDTTDIRDLLRIALTRERDGRRGRGRRRSGRDQLGRDELQPDLVLLDLAMPVMDGLEALPRLKSEAGPGLQGGHRLRFRAARDGVWQVVEAGADGYLDEGHAAARDRGVRRGRSSTRLTPGDRATMDGVSRDLTATSTPPSPRGSSAPPTAWCPAVVQQHGTGEVLMLGWMDDEALARTLTTGRATYWSRSPPGVLGQGRDLRPPPVGPRGAARLRRRHAAASRSTRRAPACHTGDRTCFDADMRAGGAARTCRLSPVTTGVLRRRIAVTAGRAPRGQNGVNHVR